MLETVRKLSNNALVLGLVSVPLLIIFFIFGIITAFMARKRGKSALTLIEQNPQLYGQYRERARGGIILANIVLILAGIFLALLLIVLVALFSLLHII